MTIINESGLYSLVMTSRKPEAKRFKRWVTGEVLPAIRKTGGYGNQAPAVNQHDPNTLRTLLLASTEREIAQAAVIEQLTPKAEALDRISASEGRCDTITALRWQSGKPYLAVLPPMGTGSRARCER